MRGGWSGVPSCSWFYIGSREIVYAGRLGISVSAIHSQFAIGSVSCLSVIGLVECDLGTNEYQLLFHGGVGFQLCWGKAHAFVIDTSCYDRLGTIYF